MHTIHSTNRYTRHVMLLLLLLFVIIPKYHNLNTKVGRYVHILKIPISHYTTSILLKPIS